MTQEATGPPARMPRMGWWICSGIRCVSLLGTIVLRARRRLGSMWPLGMAVEDGGSLISSPTHADDRAIVRNGTPAPDSKRIRLLFQNILRLNGIEHGLMPP